MRFAHPSPGINQSDILKLKSAGFYTVAVSYPASGSRGRMLMHRSTGCSRSAQQASSQDPRLLRNQGRKGQGGCQEESGMDKPHCR
jgi:hypothetical protein